ncbi:hypothetical protein LIER_18267 [Lithospermum erythrorhizon]|uniref:Uncharacterized protein n=1 Tax=Lithospermum erythrorhizon TaxID=34254 RepID=A0AAV3QHG1_LITER
MQVSDDIFTESGATTQRKREKIVVQAANVELILGCKSEMHTPNASFTKAESHEEGRGASAQSVATECIGEEFYEVQRFDLLQEIGNDDASDLGSNQGAITTDLPRVQGNIVKRDGEVQDLMSSVMQQPDQVENGGLSSPHTPEDRTNKSEFHMPRLMMAEVAKSAANGFK